MNMKLVFRPLSLLVLAGASTYMMSCKDHPKPQPEEQMQLTKLAKTWSIVSATLDGTPRTTDFSGFTLTISGTFSAASPKGPYSYMVGGSRPTPSPWPESGNWSFGTDAGSQLLRDDDGGSLPVVYTLDSSGVLTLQFQCSACNYPGARTSAVNGVWSFSLH